tara:strand:- start:246 stop:437 length:192 start_codon:yes stop_codon:yes gene_type:complete
MAKKKKYVAPKTNQKELDDFQEHCKLMNEKSKAISAKYKKWWDIKKKRWKPNFVGHEGWQFLL